LICLDFHTEGKLQKLPNRWGKTDHQLLGSENFKYSLYKRKTQIMVVDALATLFILGHTDLLLDNAAKQTTRQRPINNNRGTVFSVQSVTRCYKQVS
jgi:hypothetical protein